MKPIIYANHCRSGTARSRLCCALMFSWWCIIKCSTAALLAADKNNNIVERRTLCPFLKNDSSDDRGVRRLAQSKYNYYENNPDVMERMSWRLLVTKSACTDLRGGAASKDYEDDNDEDTTTSNDQQSNSKKKKKKKKSTSGGNMKKNDIMMNQQQTKKTTTSISIQKQHDGDSEQRKPSNTSKKEIEKAMKRSNDPPHPGTSKLGSKVSEYDISLHSVACGIGMTPLPTIKDLSAKHSTRKRSSEEEEELSSSSILMEENILLQDSNLLVPAKDVRKTLLSNYLFQSHGGTYLFQTFASILICVTGIGSCIFAFSMATTTAGDVAAAAAAAASSSTAATTATACYLLFKQCAVLGMIKHILGLMGMISVSAKQIYKRGLYETRQVAQSIIQSRHDGAIARYLFYSTWLILWSSLGISIVNDNNTGSITATTPWWISSSNISPMVRAMTVVCLLGPLVVREILNLLWVVSDILYMVSFDPTQNTDWMASLSKTILSICSVFVNQLMNPIMRLSSSYYGSDEEERDMSWKDIDSFDRQQLLSQSVSKLSCLFEIYTGILVAFDLLVDCFEFVGISPIALWTSMTGIHNTKTSYQQHPTTRPSLSKLVKSIMCARLYFNFLLMNNSSSRQRKNKTVKRYA